MNSVGAAVLRQTLQDQTETGILPKIPAAPPPIVGKNRASEYYVMPNEHEA